MCFRITSCAAVAIVLCPTFSHAQQAPNEMQELRRTVEKLDEHLRQLEQSQGKSNANDRVTQIGSMRDGRNPETIVRIYDLSDLFAMAPAYPAMQLNDLGGAGAPLFPTATKQLSGGGGMMGGMGGGMFNVPASIQTPATAAPFLAQFGGLSADTPNGRTSMTELINAIQQTIAPDRWEDNGGPGSIAHVGTALLISADRSMHEQIDALLNLFRQRWRTLRTITVHADWLWLNAAELNTLLAPAAANGPNTAAIAVDDAALAKLLDEPAQNGSAHRAYNASITCYNGQTVHTESGGQSLAVTDMTPFVQGGQDGKALQTVIYRPTMTFLQEGAALQITPLATKSAQHVVLDVHSRVARMEKPAARQRRGDADGRGARVVKPEEIVDAIDRPRITTHRLSTTLRIPINRTVLVGGMTFESEPVAGEPNLYLFAKASVQELHDDPPPADTRPAPPAGAAKPVLPADLKNSEQQPVNGP